MKEYTNKTSRNKNQSVTNRLLHKPQHHTPVSQFSDSRPETVAQRKLQQIADNNSGIQQLTPSHKNTYSYNLLQRQNKDIGSNEGIIQKVGGEDKGYRKKLSEELHYKYGINVTDEQIDTLSSAGYSDGAIEMRIAGGATIKELLNEALAGELNKLQDNVKAFIKKGRSFDKSGLSSHTQALSSNIVTEFNKIKDILKEKEPKIKDVVWANNRIAQLQQDLQSIEEIANRQRETDSRLKNMDTHTFISTLKSESQPKEKHQKMRVINLLSGFFPSQVITIIGSFYKTGFNIQDMIEKGDKNIILGEMIDEQRHIKIDDEKQLPQKKRVYTNGKNLTDDGTEKLKQELDAKATLQSQKRSVAPKGGGKLRSWHLNNTENLERQILKGKKGTHTFAPGSQKPKGTSQFPSQKALSELWDTDMTQHTGFQNKVVGEYFNKDEKSFYDKSFNKPEPGYIEVNPEGWSEAKSQGRLIYDYFQDQWFLTTDHYQDDWFEIIVPTDFKMLHLGISSSTKEKTEAPKEKESPLYDPLNYNNCLIEAIARAAGLLLDRNIIQTIRTDLQNRDLGNIGTMLFADPQVVIRILTHLGLQNHTVILYDESGRGQELHDGTAGQVIQIYYNGALHFVSQPITDGQKSSRRKQ